MRLIVTGFNPEKKIQAIKAIRSVTGLGLKEAKDVADAVKLGPPMTIETDAFGLGVLDEYGVTYDTVSVPLDAFIAALSDYPAGMRVGDLVRVLQVVEKS